MAASDVSITIDDGSGPVTYRPLDSYPGGAWWRGESEHGAGSWKKAEVLGMVAALIYGKETNDRF